MGAIFMVKLIKTVLDTNLVVGGQEERKEERRANIDPTKHF